MPIGKNSIKRVKNSGYSAVASTAPDMENSTVLASPAPEVVEMVEKSVKKSAAKGAKKPTEKTAPAVKKTVEKKTPTAKKTNTPKAKSAEKASEKDGFVRISLGDDMPTYLL